ncbi:MAG: hypothetical protein K0S39_1741 [Paenibacillus sp.]|nr:hypothetical protein [Paenibacillus sp.]
MKQMKLSGKQIYWIMTTMALGVALLLTIQTTVSIAMQDAWISILAGGFISIFAVYIAVKLSLAYPGKTFIEYTQLILGKWLGKAILVLYFLQWYSVTGIILREFAEMMNLMLPTTPIWVIMISMLFIVMYGTNNGIDIIGRCGEFIGPVMVLFVILTILLNLNNIHMADLTPVYKETGWKPIAQGAIPTAGFIGQNVIVLMLIAFMTKPEASLPHAIWGTATASIVCTIVAVFVVATFGPEGVSSMWYPYYELIRIISVADFIQNVDILFVVVWLTSVFMRLAVIFFVTCYGVSQYLGLKNWKPVIWWNAPIVFLISLLPRDIFQSNILYPKYVTQQLTLPILIIGIPLLLLFVHLIRRKMV